MADIRFAVRDLTIQLSSFEKKSDEALKACELQDLIKLAEFSRDLTSQVTSELHRRFTATLKNLAGE